MKHLVKLFFAVLLSSLALVSCVKRVEIENLQNQINEIKQESIASIESQIGAINSSITKLESADKELNGYIETLMQKQSELQEKNQTLEDSITDLKLEIYSKISEEKAALVAQLLDTKQDIQNKISEIQAKIAELEAKTNEEGLQSQITTLKEDLAKHVADYESLVKDLATLEGILRSEITAAQNAVLSQLDAYKTEVASNLQVINNAVAALQAKEENLQAQITELKSYVYTELQNTKDWATATFATLEQYNSVCTTIAGIQASITSLNEYIATLQTKAAQDKIELEGKISELDEKTAQALQNSISQLNTIITNAKDELTAAYTSAIAIAISDLESSLKIWVNNQLAGYYTVSQVDALLAALESSMNTKLKDQKDYLEGQIFLLESTLTSKVSANTTLIEGLQVQLNTLSSSLTELASQVAQNSTDISANATAIIENAKAISANEIGISACEQLIASNKTLIEANNQKITANVQAIADLQSKDAELYAAISANLAAIQKNASDIAANSALISVNSIAIANNATAISNNAEGIAQLQESLTIAKLELTEAYTTAISTAIYTLDGKLSTELSTQISAVNKSLEDAVKTINDKICALTLRMDACEEEIDSIKDIITNILSDINDLQNQIDKILSDKIASIESQITSILASIGNLETTDAALKDYIQTLQEQYQALVITDSALTKAIEDLKAELLQNISDEKTAILLMLETYKGEVSGKLEVIGNSIVSLQAKSQELEGKITALKEYVDTEIKDTRDWAKATFATLEQYNSICTTVAGIQADLVTINTTIAALDSKVDANQKELKDLISALDEKTSGNLQNAVTQLSEAVATAKEEVTAAYTEAIESAISALEASLKNWVNSQLSGYYTIAQTNAQIEALAASTTTQLAAQKEYLEGLLALLEENLNKDTEANRTLIKENKDAIAANAKAIEENAKNIAQLRQDLESAKSEITAAYTAAITSAISELDGKLSAELTTKISAVNKALEDAVKELNTKITALSDRIDACEQDIADLKDSLEDVLEDLGNVSESLDKLLARIQSMTVVPTYADGSVKIKNKGITNINFVVFPRSASEALAKVDLSAFAMKAVETETKASMFIDIPVTKVTDNGEVLVVTVDGSSLSHEFYSGTQSLNAMFKVEDGNNARATEFFALNPVTVTPDYPDYIENGVNLGAGIAVLGDWDNDASTPKTTLYWAPVNCGYEETGEANTDSDHRLGKLYQWGAGDASLPYQNKGEAVVAREMYYDTITPSPWYDDSVVDGTTSDKWNNDRGPCPEGWRLPTRAEFKVLCSTYSKILLEGKYAGQTIPYKGAEFYGANADKTAGKGVFFPAAGCRLGNGGNAAYRGSSGKYWSSTTKSDGSSSVYQFYFKSSYLYFEYSDIRAYALSVRCVSEN